MKVKCVQGAWLEGAQWVLNDQEMNTWYRRPLERLLRLQKWTVKIHGSCCDEAKANQMMLFPSLKPPSLKRKNPHSWAGPWGLHGPDSVHLFNIFLCFYFYYENFKRKIKKNSTVDLLYLPPRVNSCYYVPMCALHVAESFGKKLQTSRYTTPQDLSGHLLRACSPQWPLRPYQT